MIHSFLTQVAYLDPGTGSIIVQAIVGAVAGVTVFGRRVIRVGMYKVKRVFSPHRADDAQTLPKPKTQAPSKKRKAPDDQA